MNPEAAFMRRAFPTPPAQTWYDTYQLPLEWRLVADLLPGAFVLDIGCASGWIAYHARRGGARVVASDIFETMVHPSLPFVLADKEALPFPDNTFDLVLTSNVLHHGDLEATVREAHRVLKVGGTFISFIEPCIPTAWDEREYLVNWCGTEVASGINEHRPHYDDYKRALCNFYEAKVVTHEPAPDIEVYHGPIRVIGVK